MAPRKVTWTPDLRRAIMVMYTEYDLDGPTRIRIFNRVFSEYLAECGLFHGVGKHALSAQWREKKKGTSGWPSITLSPANGDDRARLEQIREQICREIVDLGVGPSRTNDIASTQTTPTTPRKRTSNQTDLASEERPRKFRRARFTKETARDRYLSGVNHFVSELGVPKAQAPVPGTTPYNRQRAQTLHLTPKSYAQTQLPLTLPLSAQAHPRSSGLLYRFWDETSSGLNSDVGFVAGRFMYNNGPTPPAPECKDPVLWADMESHLDAQPIASAFISTSNFLTWTLRQAISYQEQTGRNVRITTIDQDALPERSCYYARYYCGALQQKRYLTAMGGKYYASHEVLVHAEIPRQAIVGTMNLREFRSFAERNSTMNTVLQLDLLTGSGNYRKDILRSLKARELQLTPAAIGAIAKLARWFGLTMESSSSRHFEHFIGDVVKGWGICIGHQPPTKWLQDASVFVRCMYARTELSQPPGREEEVRIAYLNGIALGLGDWNVMHDQETIEGMLRRASKVGLASATKISLVGLQTAKVAVLEYEQTRQARLAPAGESCVADCA